MHVLIQTDTKERDFDSLEVQAEDINPITNLGEDQVVRLVFNRSYQPNLSAELFSLMEDPLIAEWIAVAVFSMKDRTLIFYDALLTYSNGELELEGRDYTWIRTNNLRLMNIKELRTKRT